MNIISQAQEKTENLIPSKMHEDYSLQACTAIQLLYEECTEYTYNSSKKLFLLLPDFMVIAVLMRLLKVPKDK